MNKLLIIWLLGMNVLILGQDPQRHRIDSLLKAGTFELRKEGRFDDAVVLNKQLIKQAQEINYMEGEVWGNANLGNLLCTLNRHEESMKYLIIAEEKLGGIENYFLKAKIYGEYARNYYVLGFFEKSVENYNKAIGFALKIKNRKIQENELNYFYLNKGVAFMEKEMSHPDSAFIYLKKAYLLQPTPIIGANIAGYYMRFKKDYDSAAFYLDVAMKNYEAGNFPIYQKSIILKKLGSLHFHKKEYEKALEYYNESLKISEKIHKSKDIKELYKLISKTYKKLDNKEQSGDYLEKYTTLNDSLNNANHKTADILVNKYVKEKEKENEQKYSGIYSVFTVILALIIAGALSGYAYYRKNKKEKDILLSKHQETIVEKDLENTQLRQKVNTAFNELVQMAKDNNPEFVTRFREVYPELCQSLLELYPDINNETLKFCALLKLNFSTKDIAEYTFITPRAVQMRKNRLRKRLNIPSEEDLYVWISKVE
ncbi:tetratricopeptide (TPR) repeat protein [Chryseobacterium defluvii]|uniref:Tetratricopeptide (TPR) repeat protein n=1 Tax=Chryseobacterium defluvii TaxID=160396 RepID=A0A840K9M5_9FLAO|nr:tetratricopeptide repeat protein [Chryseobacterium defluvii]MBB4805926.1 tetratricopeptide (TPR) repeat protein [Chryseobacterium defluvii]